MKLAILNQSKARDEHVAIIAGALAIYLRHVCEAWERALIEVKFMPGMKAAPDGWSALAAFDTPDQSSCLGYHDVDAQGRAFGRAFLSMIPGGVVLRDLLGTGASLAGVLSHEAAEMALDILANAYQDGPFVDAVTGHSYAQIAVELADPVQELAYPVVFGGEVVDASNFIWPAWFNRHLASSKVDQMGVLKMPLSLAPGGYAIVRDTGADTQVFARLFRRARRQLPRPLKIYHHSTAPAPWREAMKSAPGGRTARRLAA